MHTVFLLFHFPSPPCRDLRNPTLYRVGDYDKNKQWLKGRPKPITDESTTSTADKPVSTSGSGPGPGDKRIATISGRTSMLEASQVIQGAVSGAVSGVVGNFVGITRAVRQRILPDKQLLEVGQCIPRVSLDMIECHLHVHLYISSLSRICNRRLHFGYYVIFYMFHHPSLVVSVVYMCTTEGTLLP